MNPFSQLKWALIAALLMWSPVAFGMISGHIDVFDGGLLFIAALIFAYVAMLIIGGLINRYQHTQRMVMRAQREIERIEKTHSDNTDTPKRRQAD